MKRLFDYSYGTGYVHRVPLIDGDTLAFKFYYGVLPTGSIQKSQVSSLTPVNKTLATFKDTYTITGGSSVYIYFLFPKITTDITTFTYMNFPIRFLQLPDLSVIEEGLTQIYQVYRTEYQQNGSSFNIRID